MIEYCLKHRLPEPKFSDKKRSFVVIFRKDKFTEEYLAKLNLNERQKKAIEYLKREKKITRQIYGQINSIGDTYAKKEIKELIEKNIIKRVGKGKDTYYTFVTE